MNASYAQKIARVTGMLFKAVPIPAGESIIQRDFSKRFI
jgi:hypothetical protein